MSKEIELKLRFDPEHLTTLATWLTQHAETQTALSLDNYYFDTPALALSDNRCALRIRRSGDQYEQTLKTAGNSQAGLQQRGEWNWPITSHQLDTSLLNSAEIQAHWPDDIELEQLTTLFNTRFQRQRWVWQSDLGKAEVVIDQGEILSGDMSTPLCELELELLDGDAAALWQMTEQLSEIAPLWLSDISKAERGYQLFNQQQPGAKSSANHWLRPPSLNTNATLTTALSEWLHFHFRGLLRQLEACLWLGNTQASLDALQHWQALRYFPRHCGRVVKRKQTRTLREGLDVLEEQLKLLAALVTANRFFENPDHYHQWTSLAQGFRQSLSLASGLNTVALGLNELTQHCNAVGEGQKNEGWEHFLNRQWRELQPILQQDVSRWSVHDWGSQHHMLADLLQWQWHTYALPSTTNSAIAQQLHAHQRSLSDMLAGQNLLQQVLSQALTLTSEERDDCQQALPYELQQRWQKVRKA